MAAALQILYEDDALLFVDKPPNIIVQRGYDPDEPILLDLAREHAGHLYLMQRLDRGTSGVIFFSKKAEINAKLTRQFEKRIIQKRYLAICEGALGERQIIDASLARVGPISFGVRDDGKRASTTVEPVQFTRTGSLLSIRLHSGRTHQIRVHLSAIGHPLVGDWLYGQRNAPRPMLHAAELAMMHPLTNTPLRVAAPPPDDFLEAARERGIVWRQEDIMTALECS